MEFEITLMKNVFLFSFYARPFVCLYSSFLRSPTFSALSPKIFHSSAFIRTHIALLQTRYEFSQRSYLQKAFAAVCKDSSTCFLRAHSHVEKARELYAGRGRGWRIIKSSLHISPPLCNQLLIISYRVLNKTLCGICVCSDPDLSGIHGSAATGKIIHAVF